MRISDWSSDVCSSDLEGNVALQILASTTKSPKGQNYDANSGDTDNITALVIAQLQPVRTWNSLLERSLWHAEKLHRAVAASAGELIAVDAPEAIDALLAAPRGRAVPVGAILSAAEIGTGSCREKVGS